VSVAVDLLAPLAAARANWFGLALRAAPVPAGEEGWRPAGAAAADPALLEALLARTAAGAGTRSPAVAATWHLEKHAWHVASAALAGVLVHGALPPLEGALLRDGEQGWAEAVALAPAGWAPAGGAALARALEAHLTPVVHACARHRPRRALWRSVGDRLGQAALWCGEAFGDRAAAWALGEEALAAPTALRAPAGFALVDGAPARRRTGCCLSHRRPGGPVCADCPLGARSR
jgi:hypothetical protein